MKNAADHQYMMKSEKGNDTEPFVFNESHHSARLLDGLRHLRDCRQLFDVTLIAEGQEFPAHRVVLASCSDYFHAMFTNGLKESSQDSILLSGVSASALEQLIHFAYTSNLKITKENVVEVLSGASHVQVIPAVHACETYLCSHLSLRNCVELEQIADLYSLKKLHRKVHYFMCQHWTLFTCMTDFLSLSLEQLQNILWSDFPVHCSEAEVMKGLIAWLNHDISRLSLSVNAVMDLVNVDSIDVKDMKEILATPEAQSVMAACPALQSVESAVTGAATSLVPGVVNTRGYFETVLVAGGLDNLSQGSMSNDIKYLDPDSQKLEFCTTIPHMQQADFGLEVLDNLVYVIGGCCDEYFTEVTHPYGFCFDPTTSKWISLPPMVQERCRFYLGALNGLLYAIGGEVDNSQLLDSCEAFDPERGLWFSIAPLPNVRSELAGTSLGGKLYVSGGCQDQSEQVQNQMWCYHPDINCWTECAPMLSPRADHYMFSFNNHIYVIGGWCKTDQDRKPVTSVDCYDVKSNRWQTVQNMKIPRRYCSCTLFQGQIYVIGGCGESSLDRTSKKLDRLDLKSMQWLPDYLSLPSIWEHSSVSIYLPRKA